MASQKTDNIVITVLSNINRHIETSLPGLSKNLFYFWLQQSANKTLAVYRYCRNMVFYKERMKNSREQILYHAALYNQAKKASYLYRQTLMADKAISRGEKLKADVYLCLLPSCAPTGFALKEAFGGQVVCDNVENIDVDKQTIAPGHSRSVVRMANHAAVGALFACDKLMTIGAELAKSLDRFKRPTLVLENYRNFEEVVPDVENLKSWGLPSGARILFTCGSIVQGFDIVLRGLALLPEEYHLVGLSRFPIKQQEEAATKLIHELGIAHRVHLKNFVPYEQLANVAAVAHIGLITNSIENPNAAVGLPNRFFDYLSAELPIVATPMPDVARLIESRELGAVLHKSTPQGFANAISSVTSQHAAIRQNVLLAKKEMSWETREDEIYEFLDRPKRVTMIGFRDLTKYRRFMRIARSLLARGVEVNFLFFSKKPDIENLIEGVGYYQVDDLLLPDRPVLELQKPFSDGEA